MDLLLLARVSDLDHSNSMRSYPCLLSSVPLDLLALGNALTGCSAWLKFGGEEATRGGRDLS